MIYVLTAAPTQGRGLIRFLNHPVGLGFLVKYSFLF